MAVKLRHILPMLLLPMLLLLGSCEKYRESRLKGTWEGSLGKAMTFNGNKTFTERTLLGTTTCTITKLTGTHLYYESPGLLWGTNKGELGYRIEGDTLTLTLLGNEIGTYKRRK